MSVADALRIAASKRADATCIAAALAEFESRIETEHGEWVVVVPAVVSNAVTTAVLDALQSCLHGSEVASVKVTLDGRTYVMESHQIAS
jgi:hypothetical protein